MAWLTILISQQDLYCWDINLFITAFASSLFYSTTLRTANTELPWLFKDLAILRSATRDMSCRAQHLGDTSVCWPKHTRGLFPSSHKAEGHRTVPLVAVGAGQPTRPSVVSVHVFYLAQLLKQLFGHNGRWQMIQQRAHQGNTRRKSPSTHGTVLGLLWNTSIPSQVSHCPHSDTQEHLLPIPAWMARGSLSARGCTNIHPSAARAATEKTTQTFVQLLVGAWKVQPGSLRTQLLN